MGLHISIDENCPTCHGRGEAILDEKMIDGEWWTAFGQYHCVEYHHDAAGKELLRRVAARLEQ